MWKFQRDLVAWGGCSRLVSHNMSFLHHSLFLQHGNWSVWCKCNSCSVFWRFHRKLSGTSWESRNLTSSVTSQSSKFIPHQFTAKVVVATQQKKKVGPWLLSSWTMGKQVFQAELRFLSETSTTSRSTKPMVLCHWPLSEGQRLGSCNKPWHPSDRFMGTLCQLDPIKNAAQKCCATDPLCKSLVKLMAQFRNICILSTISCQLYFLHQHSSTKGENIQHVRSSSCCHLDLIVLIDLQEKVKPNSDGSSPFALKGFGYPSTSNTCETVNQPLLKIVPAASSISLESIRNNFKPLPIMQVLFLSFIWNGVANSTVQGTSGSEYLPCAIGRAHQLALCSSSQPFGTGGFFLKKIPHHIRRSVWESPTLSSTRSR